MTGAAYIPTLDLAASPTLWDFFNDPAFFTLVEGPLGSGKSTVCAAKLMALALRQAPDPRTNLRTSRWGVFRNTSVELKNTTIKTWLELFPEASCGPMRWTAPITHRIVRPAVDGHPGLDMEVLFIAMDKVGDVKKLKSLDLTGAWVNEAVEVPQEAVDMLTGRVGRFPKKEVVPATWAGVIADTNADDDQSWVHKWKNDPSARVELDPALFDGMALNFDYRFYLQPAAMIECTPIGLGRFRINEAGFEPLEIPEKQAVPAAGRWWTMNPLAENIKYLRGGIGYYFQQMARKDLGWIQRFVQAKTVYYIDGQPWIPEYSDDLMSRDIDYDPNLPLLGGIDIGGGTLNPAAVFGQRGLLGDWRVLSEVPMLSVGLDEFEVALKAHIADRYRNAHVKFALDPASKNHDPVTNITIIDHLQKRGFNVECAPTNAMLLRRQAIASPMSRMVRLPGRQPAPAFLINRACTKVRAGLGGKWFKRRIQGADGRYAEEPTKNEWSHPCLPGDAIVATIRGPVRIDHMMAGDFVLTPNGPARVLAAAQTAVRTEFVEIITAGGHRLVATPDHTVFVHARGLVRADAIEYNDYLHHVGEIGIWRALRSLSLTAKNIGFRASITGGTSGARLGQVICTGQYSRIITVPFRRAMTFITETAIRSTMILKILSVSSAAPTEVSTPTTMGTFNDPEKRSNSRPTKQGLGTAARPDWHGIGSTGALLGPIALPSPTNANGVARGAQAGDRRPPNIAPLPASLRLAAKAAWTTLTVFAHAVAQRSASTGISKSGRVVGLARLSLDAQPVYDMTVEREHCYYANGVLVSNCDALGYMLATFGEHALLTTPTNDGSKRGEGFAAARIQGRPMTMQIKFDTFGRK